MTERTVEAALAAVRAITATQARHRRAARIQGAVAASCAVLALWWLA